MTKDEFIEQIKKVRIAYNEPEFIATKDQFDVWYSFFEPLRNDFVEKAITQCIRGCRKVPSIADIMGYYDEIKEEYDAQMLTIRNWYEVAGGLYPGHTTFNRDDAFALFKELTIGLAKGDMEKAIDFAAQLSHKCNDDFKMLEEKAMKDEEFARNFPTYYDKLKEIKEQVRKKYEQRS